MISILTFFHMQQLFPPHCRTTRTLKTTCGHRAINPQLWFDPRWGSVVPTSFVQLWVHAGWLGLPWGRGAFHATHVHAGSAEPSLKEHQNVCFNPSSSCVFTSCTPEGASHQNAASLLLVLPSAPPAWPEVVSLKPTDLVSSPVMFQ